jgi:large subunit ribosomal protein L6
MTDVQVKEKKAAPLSRLGRKPVDILAGVKVAVNGQAISVEGKRGKLSWDIPLVIGAKVEGNQIKVFPHKSGDDSKAMHGLVRKIILNMVEGVTNGFSKRLVVEGVGFRVAIAGDKLTMTLGYSHPAVFKIPKDIKITVDGKNQNILVIEGNDKQKVGEATARIRSIKLPEPYKGTGIRYENEIIKRKVGKAAVAAAGGAGAGGGAKK